MNDCYGRTFLAWDRGIVESLAGQAHVIAHGLSEPETKVTG